MRSPKVPDVSRRERQALDAVYRSGAATASDVQAAIPNPPATPPCGQCWRRSCERDICASSAKERDTSITRRSLAKRHGTRALAHVIDTFFSGSLAQGRFGMLDERSGHLSDDEARRLERLLRQSREAGR
jgi:hypothetical protein